MAAGTMYPLSLSDLKAITPSGNPNDIYYLTDAGKEGEFFVEDSDTSPFTGDDAITVASNNISGTYYRYRRIIEDGLISVRWFGAVGDGSTDDSAAIQNAVDTAEGQTIVFDFPNNHVGDAPSEFYTSYFIDNNTITVPARKVLKFRAGNRITGTGTIDGGIIDAGYDQQIFEETLNLVPEGQTSDMFSAKWLGAKGDNSHDDYPAIQKAIDTLIPLSSFKNPLKLYLPAGSYRITKPLILSLFAGGNYQAVTLHMIGDADFWPSSQTGTRIICASGGELDEGFAIGVQVGKGVIIEGLQISGAFAPPTLTSTEFYMISFDDYQSATPVRDEHYSPYAGIVIDPFCHVVPPDGGYPYLNAYYQGSAGGGSTGTTIENCLINNFVVGICSSPTDDLSSNAELTLIESVQFQACKLCISISHDQEKTNKVNRSACWGPAHTFFASHKYGKGLPGNWELDNVQLAGMVNTFVEHHAAGYFPSHIKNCYAESLGKFGSWKSGVGSKVQNCLFDFATLSNTSHSYQESYLTSNRTVVFENCTMRLYGTSYPITISGAALFKECVFDGIPCCFGDSDGMPAFADCTANGKMFAPTTTQTMPFPLNTISAYGKFELHRSDLMSTYVREKFLFDNIELQIVVAPTTTVTPAFSGTDRTFTFTALANELYMYDVGRVILGNSVPMGLITDVDPVSNDVTVSYASPLLDDTTTYTIGIVQPLVIGYPFMGNTTNNGNVIADVKGDMGQLDLNVGVWVKSHCFVTNVYYPYVKITAWDDVAKEYTVSSNSFYTQKGVHFFNGDGKDVVLTSANSSMFPYIILPVGSKIYSSGGGRPTIYSVRRTGFMNAASQSDDRQAYMAMDYPYHGFVKKAIDDDYTIQIEDDILEVDCTSGDIDIQLVQPLDVLFTGANAGKTITIRKSDSSGNVVNILKNTAGTNDPIDGQNSVVLSSQYDSVTINIGYTNAVSVGILK